MRCRKCHEVIYDKSFCGKNEQLSFLPPVTKTRLKQVERNRRLTNWYIRDARKRRYKPPQIVVHSSFNDIDYMKANYPEIYKKLYPDPSSAVSHSSAPADGRPRPLRGR
jgi:hypothetical protein